MQPLVAREVHDNLVPIAAPCLASAVAFVLTPFVAFYYKLAGMLVLWAILMPMLLLAYCALGTAQMYGDRANRISSLLATQGITRRNILAARVQVGVLTILVSLVPAALTTLVLYAFLPFYGRMLIEIPLTFFLTAVACYCIGLLVGWTTNKAWLPAGNLLLTVPVILLVAIKGFGLEALALLLLLIGAILLRTWHKFSAAPL